MIFVSILVLMDLCIKTEETGISFDTEDICFNPCFNGSMYKNISRMKKCNLLTLVSILVLMDLCIKTRKPNGDLPSL